MSAQSKQLSGPATIAGPTTFTRGTAIAAARATWIGRMLWVCAALAHVGGIARAVAVDGNWLRAVVLLLGTAFCVLKVADLAVLRLKPGWRPRLVGLLALVLVHAGMMPGLHDSVAEVWAAGSMGTTALVWLRPRVAHVLKHRRRSCRVRVDRELPLIGRIVDCAILLNRPARALARAGPRAPPRLA